jgi:hypothetical protein
MRPAAEPVAVPAPPQIPDLGTPTSTAWREETQTKVGELRGHLAWMQGVARRDHDSQALTQSALAHLKAAQEAAEDRGVRRLWAEFNGATFERALGNLDAAEADVLRLAPPEYFHGYVPSLRAHVNRYLEKDDPRRLRVEQTDGKPLSTEDCQSLMSAYHAASTQRRRDLMRLRSFRNLVFGATAALTLVAVMLAALGWQHPNWIPLCFNPVEKHQVVCPTEEVFAPGRTGMLDTVIAGAVNSRDILLVQLLGVVAAAVAGAATLRRMRGTSTPFGVPVALAVLKLPTGALTAVLGLLLMGGGFVPGLSALDSSAQIVAWAIVFGYAQQLFTRMVDDQGSGLLNKVGGHGPGGDRDPASGT